MSAGLNCANCGGLLTLTRADADGYRRWAHVENDSAQCPTQQIDRLELAFNENEKEKFKSWLT